MNKYYVTYRDDITTVWVNATSVEAAKSRVIDEYWDCKEIVDVRQA